MKKKLINETNKNMLFIMACIFIMHAVIWAFSGNTPFTPNPYNSYVLQAEAWRDGSFDLGQNYSHLELAEYDNRFFVSFPPLPSVIYFPFVLLGIPVFEGLFALISSFLGGAFTYLILKKRGISENNCILFTLLFTCGSNLLFVSVNGWVWFIAQNMCYTFTVAALYQAIKKRGLAAFTLWACAIGCRPFQIVYFPILCMILMNEHNRDIKIFIKKYYWFSGAAILGIFYMWLNYARFGNIFEFGHNYLPEFVEAANGQFHLSYLKDNLYSLIRLPGIKETGAVAFQQFNGMNIFLASPVFAVAMFYYIRDFKNNTSLKTVALITILVEILLITSHKTMGGWQFGNRYINDCLPLALVILAYSYKKQRLTKSMLLLTIYGVVFNGAGTILCYLNAL